MSDLMLLGILRMPADSIVGDCEGIMQFVSAARGAADRIEADAKLIAELRAALEAAAADTERLDFLIDRQAWVQWVMRDGSIRQCQVYDQDEDENYHILSGDDRYFNTPRAAIDAAISQLQEES
ncbi:hypothetical protein [Burkholderia multivorans]|uniref:hypothetical protein n=1 Tax=Burkholderia multivorans TaxID=87883 RepID=UPI002158C470|nr:hypothetical protein [Burkholderia multivorans]